MMVKGRLTVLFEAPFWIGLYERFDGDRYEVCKITFGAEPTDGDVYEFLLRNWRRLRFTSPVKVAPAEERRQNPKRVRREIDRLLRQKTAGTKAQLALKLQHEQDKTARRSDNRIRKEQERERQYALRQEKKKAKHRGR